MSGTSTPAGWYPDPSNPAQQRYWDGAAWTDATAPAAPAAPQPSYGAPGAPAYGAPAAPGYGAPGYGATQAGYGYAQASGAPLASFWARFGAYLVDLILLGIVTSIVAAVLGIEVAQETSAVGDNSVEFSVNGAYQLVSLAIALPYFLLLEGGSGQTLGKKLLGVQVVAADTLQPGIGPGKALLRYVGRIISTIVCFLGYLWMLWDPQKQTWHDKIASTKVIKVA